MDIILNVLNQTLVFTVPLLVVALGGMFSERSGVVNIALEGIMIGGAFVGVYFIYLMQSANPTMNPQLLLILALIVAGIFGALLSLLHAFAAINLKADQTISGTAINMLAPGLGLFLAKLQQQQFAPPASSPAHTSPAWSLLPAGANRWSGCGP